VELLTKWTTFIAVMMTTTGKLTHYAPELIPTLYRGIKELPQDQIQHVLSLKKDDWYLFPSFTTCVPEVRYQDEGYTCPDGAILFEIRGAVDGVEIGDCSQYPEDQEWLLPMFSSFSVVSVDVLPDRNHLTRVVLKMRGSLAGALRDEMFPESDRSLASVIVKKIRNDAEAMGARSQLISRFMFATLKLRERQALHPLHLLHVQYLSHFADTKRASVAKQEIEDVTVKWQQCTAEATVGGDGVLRSATWETINKKQATAIEVFFLKRTRQNKLFTGEGVTVNFGDYTVDLGKGLKRLRRLLGKFVSHPFQAL
jgi:hypothetical protein